MRSVADPGSDPDFLDTVAWLHDVVEDTKVTETQLADTFGWTVSQAVSVLSDPPGKNRKERKERLHKRLRTLDGHNPVRRAVLLVKTADRLANMRAASEKNPKLLKMYRKEHAAFRAAVWRPGLCDLLWEQIEALAEESA